MFSNANTALVKKKVTVHGKNGDYQAFRNTKVNEDVRTPREKKSITQEVKETGSITKMKNRKKKSKERKKFLKDTWNLNPFPKNNEERTEPVRNFQNRG